MALPATDNFNRADANPIGGNWSTVQGLNALQLQNNSVNGSVNNTDNAAYWNADSFANDQYSQIKKLTTSSDHGPLVRVATNNCYMADVYSTGIDIWKYVAGSWTQLGSTISITLAANDVLKLSATGTTLEIFQNGTSRGTRSDSELATGSAGIWAYNNYTNINVDDWEGGNVSGGATLVPQETTHALTNDTVVLTQQHTLTINEAVHGLSNDAVALIQAYTLTAAKATHALSNDPVALTQQHLLAISEAAHNIHSGNVTLGMPGAPSARSRMLLGVGQ
jgi:hypothetical protein